MHMIYNVLDTTLVPTQTISIRILMPNYFEMSVGTYFSLLRATQNHNSLLNVF